MRKFLYVLVFPVALMLSACGDNITISYYQLVVQFWSNPVVEESYSVKIIYANFRTYDNCTKELEKLDTNFRGNRNFNAWCMPQATKSKTTKYSD